MSEIYALSDDILTPKETIFSQMCEILNSGVKMIEFRSKNASYDENLLRKLISLCADFRAKFIINDDINLAKKLGANGVHIGKFDANLQDARRFLGHKAIIGVSCYDDLNLAINSQNDASYVAFGAMYSSQTKPKAKICDHEILAKAKEMLQIPVCAIGGINALNIGEICAYKPDFIAIASAIYKPNSICQNIQNLKKLMK